MLSKIESSLFRNLRTVGVSSRYFGAATFSTPITAISKLANGTTVATEASPGEVTSLAVWIDAGSRHGTHGAADLLQRVSLLGTKKRSAEQVRAEILNLGGKFTAHTTREHTVYRLDVVKKDLPKAVEFLSDIIQNPILDGKNVDAGKKAVADFSYPNTSAEIEEHLHEAAFHGQGLGRSIVGGDATATELQSFHNSHYNGNRFVVAAAGAVEHSQLSELVAKFFVVPSAAKPVVEAAVFIGSDKRIRYDSMKAAHISLAFQGANLSSADYFPLQLMQTILGHWNRTGYYQLNSASKFAQEVAEHDLVHSFVSFNKCYQDSGLFGVYLVADDNKLDDALWYTTSNMVRLCHNVTDEEVSRAKSQLLTDLLLKQDSAVNVVDALARDVSVHGRRITREETIARVAAVTTADIKAAANRVINDEDHVLAAKGPIFELPDYNWIRRRSYWHRY